MKKLIFTDVSLTEPGMAFSGSELMRRSANGTMPPIYHDHVPYDFEEPDDDDTTSPRRNYLQQEEATNFEPLPVYPNFDDVLASKNTIERVKDAIRVNVARTSKKSNNALKSPENAENNPKNSANTGDGEPS